MAAVSIRPQGEERCGGCNAEGERCRLPKRIKSARFVFDKTEPAYYSRTMTTPSKPYPEETSCSPQSAIRNAPLPPSTEIDTMRQSPTIHNENSCPRARATAPSHVIPAKAGAPTPTSFPRRRESLPLGMECAHVAADSWSCRPITPMPINRTEHFLHPMLLNRAKFAILHSFMPHRPSGAALEWRLDAGTVKGQDKSSRAGNPCEGKESAIEVD